MHFILKVRWRAGIIYDTGCCFPPWKLPSQRGFSQPKVWNLERMTNRCRLCPQNPLPVSLLAATDQQGWPPLDALFMGYGMLYSLHPPWIASTAKCSGSRVSLHSGHLLLCLSKWLRDGMRAKPGSTSLCCSVHQIPFTSPLILTRQDPTHMLLS